MNPISGLENESIQANPTGAVTLPATGNNLSLDDCGQLLSQLAGQAAEQNFYGLQDAALLMAEALETLSPNSATPGLLAELATLPEVFSEYCFGIDTAIAKILSILSHPTLAISLTEDELAMLGNQLQDELAALDLLAEAPLSDDGFFADLNLSEPSKETKEVLELLVLEAATIGRLLSTIELDTPEVLAGQLQILGDNLERYGNAANMAGFEGLALICGHVNSNVQACRSDLSQFTSGQLQAIVTWLDNVNDYLANFGDLGAGLRMLPQLGEPDWPLPLDMETAATILASLQANTEDGVNNEPAVRKLTATPDDVSLALPGDVNQELLDILLQELPEQTQLFSSSIQALQVGGNLADLATAQRVAHTVKGAANTVGIKGIAELTHYLEDILVACAQHEKLPGADLLDTLIAAADCLEAMSESLTDLSPPPEEALQTLQTVLDWANLIAEEGISKADAAAPQTATGHEGINQALPAETVEKSHTTMVRIATGQMDGFFRQAGENIILNSQANERLRRIKNQLQAMSAQFDLLRQLGEELDQLIDLKDLSGRRMDISTDSFDALEMDQYNELHTASRRMVEAAFDARELSLDAGKELEAMNKLLEEQQRLATETQEAIMQTRLVPVASVTPRLHRSLRQTCRLTGKHCSLEISGEHLMVDGDTLNTMLDPLMHLLRNAIDHGIEDSPIRIANGKPEQGKINIGFERDGNHIRVCVQDDGNGLDYAAIRAAAERRGAISPDQTVTEEDLKRMILRPNFSTRSQTTQISGRGVGMDVVNYQVLAQGGTLTLHSVAGQGLTVVIKIPLPLSRSHALLATIGPYRLALSNKGVQQILLTDTKGIFSDADGEWLTLDQQTYPAISLNKLLNLPSYTKTAKPHQTVLLIQNNDQLSAVLMDAVTDSLDIIVKPMGDHIKKITGFMGAAILGDGTVAPVLDLPELLRATDVAGGYGDYYLNPEALPVSTLPKVLVVDDSLSQRRALEQLLQDAGFEVSMARDGIEATGQLAENKPDIVLTDLEMPRMNGIELTAHIRARENLKDLPIIMITSRTTQTHRHMAGQAGVNQYLAKPVFEDDLLANIQQLLDNRATID